MAPAEPRQKISHESDGLVKIWKMYSFAEHQQTGLWVLSSPDECCEREGQSQSSCIHTANNSTLNVFHIEITIVVQVTGITCASSLYPIVQK